MNKLPFDKQVTIVANLAEGASIRGIERMTGVHRDTIMRLPWVTIINKSLPCWGRGAGPNSCALTGRGMFCSTTTQGIAARNPGLYSGCPSGSGTNFKLRHNRPIQNWTHCRLSLMPTILAKCVARRGQRAGAFRVRRRACGRGSGRSVRARARVGRNPAPRRGRAFPGCARSRF